MSTKKEPAPAPTVPAVPASPAPYVSTHPPREYDASVILPTHGEIVMTRKDN